jgi:tripartite-type tricarboxylate transporter receptor subunit TctC
MKPLRFGCLHFAAALCAVFAVSASAQNYPAKPVRILLGFPVGQATDVLARLVAVRLSSQYGQQFYVDNRPGAAGIIATELAAKAEPDGYTPSRARAGRWR